MTIKRRKLLPTENGVASVTPTSSAGGIRIKQRVIPKTSILDVPDTELADFIAKIRQSGEYGNSFYIGNATRFKSPRLETGILGIDLPLGGGWSMGRASMVVGEKSSGKSTQSLLAIAALHRQNPDSVAAYIDTEGTYDPAWALKLGCDTSRIVVVEPESGEHAVDLADGLVRVEQIHLLVVDSIAMLIPIKEVEAPTSQEFMGLQARLIGKFVRKTTQALLFERKREHYVHLMFLNQFRMKVGLIFGDPRTLPGGKAVEFFTSQQIEAKNKEIMFKDDSGDEVVKYNEHSIKITKNKTGGPFKESVYRLIRTPHENMPEAWVNQAGAIHAFGTKIGLVDGAKGSFSIDGISGKFKGEPAFNAWALDNIDKYYGVISKIVTGYRTKWGLS